MASKIQIRRGTAAQWTSANPVLIVGELGFETDTNLLKAGDGTTAWTSLAYYRGQPVQTVNVQTFDSSGTWTKPAGAVTTTIVLCGGGAGGNFGNSTSQGIGGAAGDVGLYQTSSSLLSATESVTIGAGGTGGTAAGVNGTYGSATSFAQYFCLGGGAGLSPQASGLSSANRSSIPLAGSAYDGGGGAGAIGSGRVGGNGAGGGGAGGVLGVDGWAGGAANTFTIVALGGSALTADRGGGAAGGLQPTGNGGNGVTSFYGFGSGGGGGAGNISGVGGNGGNGIKGSGGGAGGRCGTATISAGGNGGNGFATITTVCYS